ncbi:MAG: hypothetical protein QM778_03340 [Myxococcales bacterium]
MSSTMSLAALASEKMDAQIRREIAQLIGTQHAPVAVHVERGQITLFGDVARQEELGELATRCCSIDAVTQVQTRFWLDAELLAGVENQNSALPANA